MFRILYVFVVLSHDRQQVVHFNVTENPTAQWTAQQIVEAFPFDTVSRYLLRDRDSIYWEKIRRPVKSLGIEEVVTALDLPGNYCMSNTRLVGYVVRVCIIITVLNERQLRRKLR